ncbi:MAG: spondin domain-containing protein, partial [Gammaproteobacteria bacterium]|nr:spondin domain-containing protein [Gammaproteobacteria bacterium]
TYQATFEGKWTTAVSPGGVPGGAHFTTLIGAVHNSQVTFWSNGGTASPGMESMAELGLTGALRNEIESKGSDVLATLQQGISSGGTASATFEFSASPTHSLVTLVTMVAPSPDWFTGVSGFSLRENGEWIGSRTVDLFPYDAGTEDGEGFSLSNPPTSPQGVITRIRGMGKFSNEPIATLTFTLQTPPDDPDPPVDDPDPPVDDPDPPVDDGGLFELDTAGAASGAVFSGGATIDGGMSYLEEVPSSEPADLIVSFRPAPADVGREADIYVILKLPVHGYFQKISGGLWLPLNLAELEELRPFARKILDERETITVVDDLVGDVANMAGVTIDAHVAYAVGGNLADLTYNDESTPARMRIAAASLNE